MTGITEPTDAGPWHEYPIDADAVYAFAEATNDPNDVYRGGEMVPPMYTAALVLPALWSVHLPPGTIEGGTAGVHAEHQLSFHGPLRVGMEVKIRAQVAFTRQVKPGAMNAMRIDVCDLDGRLLRQHLWINIAVGGTLTGPPIGEPPTDATFPDEARERPLGSYKLEVDRDQGFRYAGATNEHPPHSMSDVAARREGFARKILQGMCTMSLGVGGVLYAAEVDPEAIVRLAARFSRPCHPGTRLDVQMFDAGGADGLSRRIGWEAESDGATVIKHGLVEVA